MAANPDNVRMGLNGYAYIGAVGASEPVKITDEPGADWDDEVWTDLGFISEDGLSENIEQERKQFYALGHLTAPVRTRITKSGFTFQLTFLETAVPTLSLYYAIPISGFTNVAAVTDTAPQQLKFNSVQVGEPDVRALGIDLLDGNQVKRFIIPRCEVTERGNIVHKGDELETYQFTFQPLLTVEDEADVDVKRFISNLALPA